ncbi:hypothetical protein DM860_017689 [Cuscuta australis]|uniref:X8 domain-containing protein n=1 Tax=Cuscuta australis TaxID=267555 RepID=A0A328D7L0_9ASTE|nr:hypothetical protein DM860_017689 [Cuscuta australis]
MGASLVLFVVLVFVAMADHSSGTTVTTARWCICKGGNAAALQKALDYACGVGATDCSPIKPQGQCYNPNNLRVHCSYAVNSYFQKNVDVRGSCDFASTAIITTSDPSVAGCVYPSSASGTVTSPTTAGPVTKTPSSGMPSTTTSTGGATTMRPPTTSGALGGGVNTTTPGAGSNNDVSHSSISLQGTSALLPCLAALITYAMLLQ